MRFAAAHKGSHAAAVKHGVRAASGRLVPALLLAAILATHVGLAAAAGGLSPAPSSSLISTCQGPRSTFVNEPFDVLVTRQDTSDLCTATLTTGANYFVYGGAMDPHVANETITATAKFHPGLLNISCKITCLGGQSAQHFLPLLVAPVPNPLPDNVAPLYTVTAALIYQDPATGADFLPTPTNVTEALSIFFPRPGLFPVPNETMRVVDRGVAYDWRWTQHGAIKALSSMNIVGGIGYAPAPLQFGALPAGMTRFASFAVYVADTNASVGFVPVCGANGGGRCPSVFQVSPPSLDHGWNQVTFTFSAGAAADPLTLRLTTQSAQLALLQSVALPPAAPSAPSGDHPSWMYVGVGIGAAAGVAIAIAAVVLGTRRRRGNGSESALLYTTQQV